MGAGLAAVRRGRRRDKRSKSLVVSRRFTATESTLSIAFHVARERLLSTNTLDTRPGVHGLAPPAPLSMRKAMWLLPSGLSLHAISWHCNDPSATCRAFRTPGVSPTVETAFGPPCHCFLGPGFRLAARWNRLGETVKMRTKREKTGQKWARYGLKRVNKGRTGGINWQQLSAAPLP